VGNRIPGTGPRAFDAFVAAVTAPVDLAEADFSTDETGPFHHLKIRYNHPGESD